MRRLLMVATLLVVGLCVRTNEYSVHSLNEENKLFIITLDGFRWQEVFNGADPLLLSNSSYTDQNNNSRALYWAASKEERRKKLLPFFWNVIARQGQLIGNRQYGNNMNVSNPYALSYPGYNELLTGSVDLTVYNNGKAMNKNLSVLEELNATPMYKNKVAAFASWDAFPYILNQNKSRLFINSGFENLPGQHLSTAETLVNSIQNELEDRKNTRYDELTYIACKEYVQRYKPSVVFLSFGGTDEAAHEKKYGNYLQQATNADRMIGDLWQCVQSLPEYAGKTTFLITTDHGRGASAGNWYTHGIFVRGSSQTWMALLGNAVPGEGEMKKEKQVYLKNTRALIMEILAHKNG